MKSTNTTDDNLIKTNQAGLVSIIVTVMIMLVITLITLTFSKIIRREQRQALDRQLNTQAFYAAESGINDAINALKAGPITKKKCSGPEVGVPATLDNPADIDPNPLNKVTYTCLTIDPSPPSLVYDNVGTDQSTVIPIQAKNGKVLKKIVVSWQETKGSPVGYDCGSILPDGQFPDISGRPANCEAGILRLDIVSTNKLSRADLLLNNRAVFLIPSIPPTAGTIAIDYSLIKSGDKYAISCSDTTTPRACKVTIDLPITAALGSKQYYLRAKSIYAHSAVTVSVEDKDGAAVAITGSQAIIDSTGKAQDVLRRIQVRANIGNIVPDYAIQSSDTICKILKVNPPSAELDTSVSIPSGVDSKPCDPN